jgi:hypothetical protein
LGHSILLLLLLLLACLVFIEWQWDNLVQGRKRNVSIAATACTTIQHWKHQALQQVEAISEGVVSQMANGKLRVLGACHSPFSKLPTT